MPRKKPGEAVWDNLPAKLCPMVRETADTLSGPGPCARCSGPKFEHRPHGGIAHAFEPRDPVTRAVLAARNEERR